MNQNNAAQPVLTADELKASSPFQWLARRYTPEVAESMLREHERLVLSKLRAPVAELQWSEVTEPNEQIRYTHVLAESPLGRFTIEWKSWKPHDTFCVYLDGDYLETSMGLDDAKAIALKKVFDMARALAGFAALASAPVADHGFKIWKNPNDAWWNCRARLGVGGQGLTPEEAVRDWAARNGAKASAPVADERLNALASVWRINAAEAFDYGKHKEAATLEACADELATLASAPVAGEAQPVASPTAQAFAQLAKQYPVRPTDEAQHSDDAAVDRFAIAMKAKLAAKRAAGRGGWDDKTECSAEFLSELLRGHVEKGDPLDVGNFAMMLHQRGERITSAAPQASEAVLQTILHSVRQARIAGNDWRRELALIENTVSAALSAQPGAQKNCNCATCRPHSVEMRMILCEVCGDKRCPHAADHRNECKSHPKQHNDGGAG